MSEFIHEDIKERKNVYADNVYGVSIHISVAESGQKGYFCQGCKHELQAVKSKLPNRMHFFRHVAVDVKIERKCVYSDQTYRHKLAKELLARLKHIKAPAVYKYPPKGTEGLANLIKEACLIEAHSVEMERVFYEDEHSEVKWGSGQGVDEKYLLVRPDVTFFDINGKPILFVELVATHKIDNEKKAKLRRLGINAIEIVIPKDSPAAIEAALYSSEKIKWIYNNDEEHTKYIPVPLGNTERVSPIDEQQRRLFAETFECRQAEVRNLIRTIIRVLESQQYANADRAIRSELSRIEGNTKEYRSRLEDLRERTRNSVIERYEARRRGIDEKRARLEQEEEQFERDQADLEKRYFDKREKLTGQEQEINREQKFIDRSLRGDSEIEDGIGESNQRIKEDLEFLIDREKSEIRQFEQELEAAPGKAKSDEDSLIQRFRNSTERANNEIKRIETEIAGIPGKLEEGKELLRRELEAHEAKLPGEFEPKEKQLEGEFEDLRKRAYQAVMSRNATGNSEIAVRIRRLLEASELLNDIESAQINLKRNRSAWDCFNQGTYKDWVE